MAESGKKLKFYIEDVDGNMVELDGETTIEGAYTPDFSSDEAKRYLDALVKPKEITISGTYSIPYHYQELQPNTPFSYN